MSFPARSILSRVLPAALLVSALAGCTGPTPYDKLETIKPTGSAFSRALFREYSGLARGLGVSKAPASSSFDANASYSLSGIQPQVADVATALAAKAMRSANGEEPLPEPTPPDNIFAERGRENLLRALDHGRTKAPDLAARVQADYDCWILEAPVDALHTASMHCQTAFDADLKRLKQRLNPGAAAETTAPATSAAPAAQAAANEPQFTVHFALDSARLDSAAQAVLRQVIITARKGRQSQITVVGHTDTSGTEELNKPLSLNRAKAVKAALVAMGARAPAVKISGVGEENLAVQTPEGVANAQNRRAVITLVP